MPAPLAALAPLALNAGRTVLGAANSPAGQILSTVIPGLLPKPQDQQK